MEAILLIIGLMAYDSDSGGGLSTININNTYSSIEQCEKYKDIYEKAYEKLDDGIYVTVELAYSNCIGVTDD